MNTLNTGEGERQSSCYASLLELFIIGELYFLVGELACNHWVPGAGAGCTHPPFLPACVLERRILQRGVYMGLLWLLKQQRNGCLAQLCQCRRFSFVFFVFLKISMVCDFILV